MEEKSPDVVGIKKRPELVALFRGRPKPRPEIAISERRASDQPASQDNNQPQDWWTRMTTAFNEFMNTISQGLARIWRELFGGYFG